MAEDQAATVVVREQVIDDLASGLTLYFWRTSDGEGRIRITGDALPFGNRDLQFDAEGCHVGSGTAVGDACPLKGLRLVPEPEAQ
jgi:hypothetical protein